MDRLKRIESLIKEFCDRKQSTIKTTKELDTKIMNEAVLAQETAKKARTVLSQPNVWSPIMKRKIVQLAAAAAIIVGIILELNYLGAPVDGASDAFAAAMDSVIQAGTFSCTEIFEMDYEDGETHGTYLLKQKLMFKEPDWERREQLTSPWPKNVGEITITRYDTRQRLIIRPIEKTATLQDMSSEYDINEETNELKLTQLNTRLRDYLLELSAGAIEDLGIVELDGQSVRLLRSRKDTRIATVWLDHEKNYPVQIELTWTVKDREPIMFASIQIDTALDDDLFSLEPPKGYTLSVNESSRSDDQAKMMTKMRYLGMWCVIYANDNDDQFPDELADLVVANVTTEESLNKTLAAPDDPDGLPVIQYRKPNTQNHDWSTEIILYEMVDPWPNDGVVVCFADGHCEQIVDHNRFEELIR